MHDTAHQAITCERGFIITLAQAKAVFQMFIGHRQWWRRGRTQRGTTRCHEASGSAEEQHNEAQHDAMKPDFISD